MLYLTLNARLAFLFFLFLYHQSYCQQEYVGTNGTDCISPYLSKPRRYICNGPQTCISFVSFRANPRYDSATNISDLLESNSSDIVLLNKLSSTNEKIPSNQLVIVPISCSCSHNFYQHITRYTLLRGDGGEIISSKFYGLTKFQGLTHCEIPENPYGTFFTIMLYPGQNLPFRIKCACPTNDQTSQGIFSLLIYVPKEGEALQEIGQKFSVTEESIMKANKITANSTIYPDFPMLVPLTNQSCNGNPHIFFCYCRKGYIVDELTNSFKCVADGKRFPAKPVVIIGLSVGLGFLCFSIVTFQSHKYLKKRRQRIRKEKLFKQNGGYLLQQMCSIYRSKESSRIFSAQMLQSATDNFNKTRFLGQGGFGSVYKGMLHDGTVVAVKRSKTIDKDRIEQFINEIMILSQINHRNIVKLLGCCLETEAPLLVYEYISNGTLSDHIHSQNPEYFLPWEDRLRIACEVAEAIAYMHSAASTPIFHRDIKPSNILLDEKYTSKVSDFGTSRLVPYDKTHLTTIVQGTFGYLDPEYFQSSQFTDKSDVYSFGVVLVELLTSKKPISVSNNEIEGGVNLIVNFISLTKENNLLEIIDDRVAMEAREEELLVMAILAERCLRLNSRERPTMKEVAIELERLNKRSQRCLETCHNHPLEEEEEEEEDDDDEEKLLQQSETSLSTTSFQSYPLEDNDCDTWYTR